MKPIKRSAYFFCFLFLSTVTIFFYQVPCLAFSETGHMLVAQIARDTVKPQTLDKINHMLSVPVPFPKASANTDIVSPMHFSEQLNTMVLASSWADGIKSYKDWNDYHIFAAFHFYDQKLIIYPYKTPRFNKETHFTYNSDNLSSAMFACIKTLTTRSASDEERSVALRIFIHLVGDEHQPFHVTNPVFLHEGRQYSTLGANNISISLATPLYANHLSLDKGKWQIIKRRAPEFHAYIDSGANAILNLPAPWSKFWQQDQVKYLKYMKNESLALKKIFSSNKRSSIISPDIFVTILKSYKLANQLSSPISGLVSYKIGKNNHWNISTLVISFPHGTHAYLKMVSPLMLHQFYFGGMQLAYYLDAIYSPSQANPEFVKYVNSIKEDPHIPTLFKLVQQLKNRSHSL